MAINFYCVIFLICCILTEGSIAQSITVDCTYRGRLLESGVFLEAIQLTVSQWPYWRRLSFNSYMNSLKKTLESDATEEQKINEIVRLLGSYSNNDITWKYNFYDVTIFAINGAIWGNLHDFILCGNYTVCPTGWTFHAVYCYRAYETNGVGFTFAEALDQCHAHAADLLSVHSNAENEFITQLLTTLGSSTTLLFRIGLHLTWSNNVNGAVTGSSWTDGSQPDYPPSFTPSSPPWNSGEPNNGQNCAEQCEDCVNIYGINPIIPTGRWNDLPCGTLAHPDQQIKVGFICKKKHP